MRKVILNFAIFGFATVLFGQNNPETILWKVKKLGSSKESFLFGPAVRGLPKGDSGLFNVAAGSVIRDQRKQVEQRQNLRMSPAYIIRNQQTVHVVPFAVVEWVDGLTRREYAYLVVERLNYCHREKDLLIHAWCLMPNHLQ